jgi:AhpD family alkylhydroperoxidase
MEQPPSAPSTKELAQLRKELAPQTSEAFKQFAKQVFSDGALPAKVKQLIAVAVAHVTQCSNCIRTHTELALKKGASPEEIMEAMWVAAEIRAGGAFSHSLTALEVVQEFQKQQQQQQQQQQQK